MIEHDDPRLTTYVVDEVDPATRAVIEGALEESPSARHEAEEIRAAAALLAEALGREESPALRAEQRATITRAHAPVTRRVPAAWLGAAAAVIAAATVAVALWRPASPREERAANVPATTLSTAPEAAIRATPGPTAEKRPSTSPSAAPGRVAARRRAVPRATVVVRGVVTDSSGAVIPGATIAAHSLTTGATATATSDARGEFEIQDRLKGRLLLTAELTGFTTTRQEVAPSGVVAWKPVLRVAALAEEVTVQASAPTVDVTSTAVSSYIQEGASKRGFNTESYAYRADNEFVAVARHPQSTFSVDVDTASYANVRRFLNDDELPPADAVRIEELVNYFPYDYAPPSREPFAAHLELGPAPWQPDHRVLRIGLRARDIAEGNRPPSNLVFLVDVSGSMDEPNKLPLVQRSLEMLVNRLDGRDRIAIVVYAGAAGLVLPATIGENKAAILDAIRRLEPSGSTNGAQGITLAYEIAAANFLPGGNNRVILATDGDFNVGVTDHGSLTRLVQQRARGGVFLSVLGFGTGNYKDSTMELLAQHGNGNYAYVDTPNEARKALVEQLMSTLVTVAKDVKIQVEFNPAQVHSYRLLGYENRLLNPEDFEDDAKDAGDVGAGHTVTALYEIVPAGAESPVPAIEPLRYQDRPSLTAAARTDELGRVSVRYKEPRGNRSRLLRFPIPGRSAAFADTTADFRFAAAVAAFGMLLRDSPHAGAATFDTVLELAGSATAGDAGGYRAEFVELVAKAKELRAEATGVSEQPPNDPR